MRQVFFALVLILTACDREFGDYQAPPHFEIDSLFLLGVHYNTTARFDSGRVYLEKALRLSGGREWQGGRVVTNIANSYGFQGRYIEALKYYLEAFEVSEKMSAERKGSNRWIWGKTNSLRVIANAAEAYYLMGNLNHALAYTGQGERIMEEMDEYYGYSHDSGLPEHPLSYIYPQVLYIAGSVWLDRGNVDKAEEYFTKAFKIARNLAGKSVNAKDKNASGNFWYCSYGKEGLAQVCLVRKDYAKALGHAREAVEYAELHGDPQVTAKVLTAFSDIYLAQGNYAECERFALQAMDYDSNYVKLNPALAYNIAVAGLYAGNRERAGEFFRIYSNRMKSNTDRKFRETMASMEVFYETEKKELRIADLERQKILYVFIGIVCVILTVLIWIFLRQKIKNERREKKLIATNAILEWEKKERKRFASDLHDGINGMLAAIKFELNTVENLESIRGQLDKCIETIRCMARSRRPTSLERYGLKASLEDYCRLFPNVDFHFFGENRRMDERLELTVYYCAYELVNNAFRHSGAKNINVQLMQDGGSVSLTVQDDGCGFDEKSGAEGSGLKNIRDRVDSFNGKIDIAASPGKGAEINIELKENM